MVSMDCPLGHYDSLPYMTFVAFSGWLAHDGSNVNTKSIDSIQDDDGAYCPLPQPFTPRFSSAAQQFAFHAGGSAAATAIPGFAFRRVDPARTGDAPGAKRSEAVPQPASSAVAAAHGARDVRSTIENIEAFVAPMVLLQGARAGLRHARKAADERNHRVSFTSAGGVRSVMFQLSYDAEQLAVTGVKPGTDLPKSARITLQLRA